jgi:hypothetical protein
LLIQLFDGRYFCTGKDRNILDVTAEVANLIERVPSRHFHGDFARDIGNGHRHMEEMLFRVCERHFVSDGGVARGAGQGKKQEAEERQNPQSAPTQS